MSRNVNIIDCLEICLGSILDGVDLNLRHSAWLVEMVILTNQALLHWIASSIVLYFGRLTAVYYISW